MSEDHGTTRRHTVTETTHRHAASSPVLSPDITASITVRYARQFADLRSIWRLEQPMRCRSVSEQEGGEGHDIDNGVLHDLVYLDAGVGNRPGCRQPRPHHGAASGP